NACAGSSLRQRLAEFLQDGKRRLQIRGGHARISPEPLATNRVSSITQRAGPLLPSIRENSSCAAVAPIVAGSWLTTVTGGLRLSASGKSSKPTRATRRPASPSPSIAPIVIRSLDANTAVGGSSRFIRAAIAAAASARVRSP